MAAADDVDVSDADYCMDDPDKDYTNQHYTPFRSTQIGQLYYRIG
jgi:hypothetical protein